MNILVATLANLFFVSSAVFAEGGVAIICEVKKEYIGGAIDGDIVSQDRATQIFHDYKIFDDRLETSFDGSCAEMGGVITSTEITVLCEHTVVEIDRRNGKYKYSQLGAVRGQGYAILEGLCKKATGF